MTILGYLALFPIALIAIFFAIPRSKRRGMAYVFPIIARVYSLAVTVLVIAVNKRWISP